MEGPWPPPSLPADMTDPEARAKLLEAMQARHPLPGFYPVVVIAVAGEAFADTLMALLRDRLGEAPYRLTTRSSKQGYYVSYHLELFVMEAEAALSMKEAIALLDGVRVLL